MATITRYVNTASTAGGDGTTNNTTGATRAYATLNEFESNEQQDLTDAGGDIMDCICEGSAADTVATVIAGWTTASASYLQMRTTQANRHDGQWNAGKYRLMPADDVAIEAFDEHVRVFGVQFTITAPTSNHSIVSSRILSAGSEHQYAYNIVDGQGSSFLIGMAVSDPDCVFKFWNNVVFDCERANNSNYQIGGAAGSWYYNNTSVGGYRGFEGSSSNADMQNNTAYGASVAGFGGTFDTTNSGYNLSDDTSWPGSNNINTAQAGTDLFTDYTGRDLSVKDSGADTYNAGTDLSSFLTDDILAISRPQASTYDIGAHEFVVVGGATGKSNPLSGPLGGPLTGPIG